ncbi:MAG: nucleotide exchange factor GrpE [Bacteriovoracaceae bacterium]|nr:nucleotide exchange factor GrpE [Bacteroidota bacterium]
MADQNTEELKNEQTQQQETPEQQLPQKSEVEIANEAIVAVKDQLLRKAAEFENYKKRTEQNALNFAKYASENVILDLLPIIDDLSRSLKSGKEKLENDPFYKGIELILNKFAKILESQGVKSIESVGKEFNVDFHDVMMQVPRTDVAPHVIVDEIEKGYVLYDKVIRHAKVVVAMAPVEEEVKN